MAAQKVPTYRTISGGKSAGTVGGRHGYAMAAKVTPNVVAAMTKTTGKTAPKRPRGE